MQQEGKTKESNYQSNRLSPAVSPRVLDWVRLPLPDSSIRRGHQFADTFIPFIVSAC